jgi:G3E family GTPase
MKKGLNCQYQLEPIATPNVATDTPCPDIQEPAANAGDSLPMAFVIESGQTAMVQSPHPPVQAVISSLQTELINPSQQTEFVDLLRRVCPRLSETASVLTDLMVDQIEFADVLIINKIKTVDEATCIRIRNLCKMLNHNTKVLETSYSCVDVKEILDTGRFNFIKAALGAG